jgi:hypothetical protein
MRANEEEIAMVALELEQFLRIHCPHTIRQAILPEKATSAGAADFIGSHYCPVEGLQCPSQGAGGEELGW